VTARDVIRSRIRERGPITVAEFMQIALYEPDVGYYARAPQRSGRAGDFFTSVDVGPLFGELIAVQIEEMARLLDPDGSALFDLVEAGAGNGRLSKDVLDTIHDEFPSLYSRVGLSLVEVSAEARACQRDTLAGHDARVIYSGPLLPPRIQGVIVANELLDAFPVHVLERTAGGIQEIFVAERNGALVEVRGEVSTPRLLDWLEAHDLAELPQGARIEAALQADSWIAAAAASLERGFLLLFDYGHESRELLSPGHAGGTLTSYRSHTADARSWLAHPGDADLTSHVNLTAIRHAAAAGGLCVAGLADQTHFLIALGLAERLEAGHDVASIKRRLSARTLIMPGGLGSTMKAMVFTKGFTTPPALRGLVSARVS
jgi:SAM-dependent MidA family methyltransferase